METIAASLEILINDYAPLLNQLSIDELSFKPSPYKWSKKEILGHLIDSAQNNIRRFIVSQCEETPTVIYDQDKWVIINNYQHSKTSDLINLWFLLNKQIVSILKNTSYEMAQRNCRTKEAYTIKWLAEDYVKHLKHHVHQVLNYEPVAYP